MRCERECHKTISAAVRAHHCDKQSGRCKGPVHARLSDVDKAQLVYAPLPAAAKRKAQSAELRLLRSKRGIWHVVDRVCTRYSERYK